MKKKLIYITFCALILSCFDVVRKQDIVNSLIYNVEALADGGDWGTKDYYISKARSREFTESIPKCRRLGLSDVEINSIKRWNTSTQSYECVYHCCWDAEYLTDSCHPYDSGANECGLCWPKQGLIGLWDYEHQCKNDAFEE